MAYAKDAMVLCLDVGPAMNSAPPGHETAFETSIHCINMILQRKVFAESKDEIGLVLFGTAETDNPLSTAGYDNITVSRNLLTVDFEFLESIQNEVSLGENNTDFIDALVVCLDMLRSQTSTGKYANRRIVLFSTLNSAFSVDKLDLIIAGCKELNIDFNVIGPDVPPEVDDDDDDAPDNCHAENSGPGPSTSTSAASHYPPSANRKPKSAQQRSGEKLIREILDGGIEGNMLSFQQVLPLLSHFQSRAVRPTAWKAVLEITPELQIPISRYTKVKASTLKTFKKLWSGAVPGQDSDVQDVRSFHKEDEDETVVVKENTARGYMYGKDIVPFTEQDENGMKYSAEKCLQLLGFTAKEHVKRYQWLGDSLWVVFAQPGDGVAQIALNTFIQAMYETDTCAIVRYNYSKATQPKLAALLPRIKTDNQFLVMVCLPYVDDLRQYTFASLTQTRKHKPTDEQLAAVDELIDVMDLSKANESVHGRPEELFKPKLTFNPYFQRFYQCSLHRAFHPDSELPGLNPILAHYIEPNTEIQNATLTVLSNLKSVFPLQTVTAHKQNTSAQDVFQQPPSDEPVDKKSKPDDDDDGRATGSDTGIKTLAGLALTPVTTIGTVDPVNDFRIIIKRNIMSFSQVAESMNLRIMQLITTSFGGDLHTKVLECMKVLRAECVRRSEVILFNKFLSDLKESGKLAGELWLALVKDKISLICDEECSCSTVSRQKSDSFLQESSAAGKDDNDLQDESADDLLAMMD